MSLKEIVQRKYEEKGLKGWDKNIEIACQLLSWAKQTQHREVDIIYCLLPTDCSCKKLKATYKNTSALAAASPFGATEDGSAWHGAVLGSAYNKSPL